MFDSILDQTPAKLTENFIS